MRLRSGGGNARRREMIDMRGQQQTESDGPQRGAQRDPDQQRVRRSGQETDNWDAVAEGDKQRQQHQQIGGNDRDLGIPALPASHSGTQSVAPASENHTSHHHARCRSTASEPAVTTVKYAKSGRACGVSLSTSSGTA